MKKTLLIIALIVAFTIPASAQFRFGIKAGFNANSLRISEDLWSSDNRVGFTGGAMIEFTAPIIGIGIDASAMYVRRTAKFFETNNFSVSAHRDYIDIPVNLKWKINLPAINHIIRPYLATGPSFAFLVRKNDEAKALENQKCDISWNIGFGVELFKHLQVGASYGIGMTKTLKLFKLGESGDRLTIEGKNKYWTVTAAYLF